MFDLLLLRELLPWCFSQSACLRVRAHVLTGNCEWTRARLLCLRFAETGRDFADKWREQVTAQSDYHKEGREKSGTKDLPGLSLYISPPSFHWLMAHKWKQTLKGEDEKHSLLKAMGPWKNTAVLSEKWTTVEFTNRSSLKCASHIRMSEVGSLLFRSLTFLQCESQSSLKAHIK